MPERRARKWAFIVTSTTAAVCWVSVGVAAILYTKGIHQEQRLDSNAKQITQNLEAIRKLRAQIQQLENDILRMNKERR